MIRRLNDAWFVMLLLLFSGKMVFGLIPVDTISKYEYLDATVFQETKLINNQAELDSLLKNTGYDSTRARIKLTKQPDYEQMTVFAFIGWPCSIDSVVEEQNTITIEYHLDYYNNNQFKSARPSDEVKICTMQKSLKTVIFVNNSISSIKRQLLPFSTNNHKKSISKKQFDVSGKVLYTNRVANKVIFVVEEENKMSRIIHLK